MAVRVEGLEESLLDVRVGGGGFGAVDDVVSGCGRIISTPKGRGERDEGRRTSEKRAQKASEQKSDDSDEKDERQRVSPPCRNVPVAVDRRLGDDDGSGGVDDGVAEAGERVRVEDVEKGTADGGVGGDGVASRSLWEGVSV